MSTNFGSTGVEHRESYFRGLKPKDDPFYFSSTWGIGFYGSKTPYLSYNFYVANLFRKYGDQWNEAFQTMAHRRLKSWGINTLACWSDPAISKQQKTPYVAFFRAEECPILAGAEQRWTKFVDVFEEEFEQTVIAGVKSCQSSVGDPWCIGFYVDNELYWGEDHSLGLWTIKSPASQAAKIELVRDLKAKYDSIKSLNAAWGGEYKSWEAFSAATETPDLTKASDDLIAFSKKFSEKYFQTIKSVLNDRAPNQPYLGCRFIWDNETAIRAACKSCDVVSFNRYRYSVDDLRLPKGEDLPVLIGEFHFGALDRGMFHPSKVPAKNQADRARCYKNFVRSALSHPNIIGTHWFQYTSEPTSGRGDGENYQVGLLTCVTPLIKKQLRLREKLDMGCTNSGPTENK